VSSLLDSFDQAASAAAAPAPAKKKSLTEAFDAAVAAPSAAAAPPPAAPKHWWEVSPEEQAQIDKMKDESGGAGGGILQVGAHAVTSAFGNLAGLARAAGAAAGGANFNEAVGELEKTRDALTYNPPAGSAGDTLLQTAGGMKYSPLRLLANATGWLGDQTLAKTDSPALATLADVGTNAAATLGAGKLIGRVAGPARESAAVPERVEPTLAPPPPAAAVAAPSPPVNLQLAPQEAVPARPAPFPGTEAPAAAPTAAPAVPGRAVTAPAPQPTISDASRGVFAESNPDVAGGLPAAEQSRRAAVLREIGLDKVRASAVTGDAGAASTDFQTSRLDSPAGREMRNAIAAEKTAISDYADKITQDTGGSALNDQSAKLARGEAILTPLEGLKEWFDNQTSALYKQADERAQGVPTQLDNFRSVLGDDSLATNSDRVNLRTAAAAYAKKLGIVDDQGNVFANAQQAETMRKYLNENWSPQNSGLVGKLKDALDSDVMAAAGEDVYGQARALRAQRAATLDNPNGIAKLLDSSGPQGVNRAVPVEKVADALTNMPVAQLKNIVDTLRNMPPELQPMAQDALAEIKAQYAHNVMDIGSKQAGQWNAKGVRQYLANNSARMQQVFEPELMQRFGTLNDAGNILAKDQSYPGAFAQHQNLVRAGVTHAITSGTAAAGAAIGGPMGGALGGLVGNKLAGKYNDSATLRATQKRMTKLSDLVPDDDQ